MMDRSTPFILLCVGIVFSTIVSGINLLLKLLEKTTPTAVAILILAFSILSAISLAALTLKKKKKIKVKPHSEPKPDLNTNPTPHPTLEPSPPTTAISTVKTTNPLTMILMRAETLRSNIEESLKENNHGSEYAAHIEKQIHRITLITNELKSLSAESENEPFETTSLDLILKQTLSLHFDRFSKKQIKLHELPVTNIQIHCQPKQLSQAIIHLISNSIDAIEKLEDPWIKITCEERYGKIIISIIDSGKGVPQSVIHKIMDPFFTTKSIGKGSGLGLSIAKGIIEKNSGSLRLNPEHEHTCFTVELPFA